MAKMMTVREAASRWGIPDTLVTRYCRTGRVEGAIKEGRSWKIPEGAAKPANRRITKQVVEGLPSVKRPLPIGVSDFRVACEQYYYVDKTMLIKEFLDERPIVSLFTRPRRFGKTLNMDMLRTFFELSGENTSRYFTDKKIWACGERYRQYQGKYPVIFLTFKDVKCESWEETYELISMLLRQEYKRHPELLNSPKNTNTDYYRKIIDEQAGENDYMLSLMYLSQMLHEHHGIAPIIIIDEYDTPIQQGHECGFYDRIILFMRNLFSGGLKDNPHLSYGFLTGILRVAKESIFSGLNNISVHSILDDKYSEYFGFTPEEIKEMTAYYEATDKYGEICDWYDGYRFGTTEIFNPWSVINYFYRHCEARPYWLSTGSNAIIGEVLSKADEEIYLRLTKLLQGETFTTFVDTSVIYPEIRKNPSSIYSFLLVAGYLKVLRSDLSISGDYICEVGLPNREIAYVYNKEILEKLENIMPQSIAIAIQESLYNNDAEAIKIQLRKLLMEAVSCYDTAGENFYHGLVLGLCAVANNQYYITSNRESGEGRYDIQLMPRDISRPGILMELKAAKNCTEEVLHELALAALQQIYDRQYDTEMTAKGVQRIIKLGVAFSGKKVDVVSEMKKNIL
ncbi:MAG: AAA family ATPase [Lachnospiraceae bacterium]|nr:AAA family ATPase [Lachnospiraceae bacterium]